MEKISIIIPTYNRAYCISHAIESVLRQTYREFELIIVDDGSSDNTQDVINSIEDERIHYIKMPENQGASAARNEGIRQAAYDYIAFQDSDDWWKPDKLEKQMQTLMDNPQAGMIYCEYECHRFDGDIYIVPNAGIPLHDKQGDLYFKLLNNNTIGTPTVLVRRECFSKVGLFCEELNCLEDWELFVRIAKEYEILFLKEPLVVVNLEQGGVSTNLVEYYKSRCYMIAKHKDALLQSGQFDKIVETFLGGAMEMGILEPTAQLLQCYLDRM
ncbi:MAG: glycosyltransferase [Bacillus sp. (in: Bacteria)]|nr:glycosyltransferase [Bacillus sp. (in: firmicutes)]MCM1425846.1 glycosyltransferase [Eubacterium sp.]